MYYLSGYEHEGMLGVVDTEDNKEEFFPREVLLGSGQTIYGLNASLGVGTKFSNDYFDFEVEERGIHVTLREDLKSSTSLKLGLPPTIACIKIISLVNCFYNCSDLTFLDLTNFATRNVKNMDYMFFGCDSLSSLNLCSFDTRNVKSMRSMFCYCHSLTSLNLSSFDTRNVEDMSSMFYFTSLNSLDLSSFDTRNVKDMSCMFSACKLLTSLDLSSFNTGNVKDMSYVFSWLGLTSLDLSSFDTGNVEDMKGMFHGCESLAYLNLSSFDTRNVEDMKYMFNCCESLTFLDFSNFDTRNVKDMRHMFDGCTCVIFSSIDMSYDGLMLLTRNHSSEYETIKVKRGTSKEAIAAKVTLTGFRGTYNLEEV